MSIYTYTPLLAVPFQTGSNANDYNAGPITWNNGDRVMVSVISEAAVGDVCTMTDLTGLAFSRVGTRTVNTNGWGTTLDLFTAVATAGGSAQDLHATFGGIGGGSVTIDPVSVSPAGALGTPVASTDGSDITIAALQDVNSDALGFWGSSAGTGAVPTIGAGFTEIQKASGASLPGTLAEFRTNVTLVGCDASTHNVGIAVEIHSVGPTAATSGTAATGATETALRQSAGPGTFVLTVAGDTLNTFDSTIKQAVLDGVVSAQSEAQGWNAVRALIDASTAVVRTSSTVITITIPSLPTYNITALEVLTPTIPASALVGGVAIVAAPTITITPVVEPWSIRAARISPSVRLG